MAELDLDVRAIPPPEKHPAIVRAFEALAPGQSFTLINDHDPYRIRYQLQGTVEWSYLETGPTVWRVRIAKRG
jgi:uncharacterized protein (DUF2249 family)